MTWTTCSSSCQPRSRGGSGLAITASWTRLLLLTREAGPQWPGGDVLVVNLMVVLLLRLAGSGPRRNLQQLLFRPRQRPLQPAGSAVLNTTQLSVLTG